MRSGIAKSPSPESNPNALKIEYLNESNAGKAIGIFFLVIIIVSVASGLWGYISELESYDVLKNLSILEILDILVDADTMITFDIPESLTPGRYFGVLLPMIVFFALIAAISIILGHRKMVTLSSNIERLKEQGVRTIGNLIRIEKRSKSYYYVAEYLDPDTGEKKRINTPDLDDYPCINNSDLPLSAAVYILGDTVRVDEIINAPVAKIKQKRKIRKTALSLVLGSMAAICVLAMIFGVVGFAIGFAVLFVVVIGIMAYERRTASWWQ